MKDAEVKMAHMLVETLAGDFDVSDFEDDYAEAVQELVKAKIEGGEIKKTPTSTKSSGEVVDLLAALQKSVEAAKTARGESDGAKPKKKPGQEDREEGCQEEGQLTLGYGAVGADSAASASRADHSASVVDAPLVGGVEQGDRGVEVGEAEDRPPRVVGLDREPRPAPSVTSRRSAPRGRSAARRAPRWRRPRP